MTSAAAFAREYTFAWKSLAPTMDIFIRRLNADLYEREAPPLISATEPNRRALINEASFVLFRKSVAERWSDWRPSNDQIGEAIGSVLRLMSFYGESSLNATLNEFERWELLSLIDRHRMFFLTKARAREIEFSPEFSGCGFIDGSAGDVFCRSTLFEIKAGDRSFRSVDLRQLLVYSALNSAPQARDIKRIGLFNPRRGVSFVGDIDHVCAEISGRPASELQMELVRLISSGDVSR